MNGDRHVRDGTLTRRSARASVNSSQLRMPRRARVLRRCSAAAALSYLPRTSPYHRCTDARSLRLAWWPTWRSKAAYRASTCGLVTTCSCAQRPGLRLTLSPLRSVGSNSVDSIGSVTNEVSVVKFGSTGTYLTANPKRLPREWVSVRWCSSARSRCSTRRHWVARRISEYRWAGG